MTKNLDGIKKLNSEEIKKYRKIVLNYIGEKDSTEVVKQKSSGQSASLSKRVDGVNVNKANRFAAKVKEAPAQGKTAGFLSEAQEESVKSREREEERMREAIKRQEAERKRINEEEKQYLIDKRRAEEAKERAEKLRLEELEEEKQRRIRENLEREKAKREEEINQLNRQKEIKDQAVRERKRLKRLRAWRKAKKRFNFKLRIAFSRVKRNLLYVVSFFVIFLAIAYIVFCLAVLRFNNRLIGWAANYLPVPAVITSQGIISYNDFRKIEDNSYLILSLAEKKSYLARWEILRNLREKYKLPADTTSEALVIKYVLDEDLNQAGLSRINKISELLKSQSEFEPLGRYADEYNDGAYYDSASVTEKFGSKISLAIGQTSQVLPRANGYYLVKRIDDKNGQLGLKYIFVKSLILNQYLAKEISKTSVFILAN